jgi:hypothetical protein
MIIELTPSDVRLIEAALDAYEKQPSADGFSTSMLGMMLTPKDERDGWKSDMQNTMRRAEADVKARRNAGILLRAKLIQASAVASEHEEVQP